MKRRRSARWTVPAAAGLVLAAPVTAGVRHSVPVYLLVGAAMLFFVKVMPFCRRRQNLWMFFLCAVCTIPMNLSLVLRYVRVRSLLWRLLLCCLAYLLLLSAEEITMGAITRRLWPRQYRLPYSRPDAE